MKSEMTSEEGTHEYEMSDRDSGNENINETEENLNFMRKREEQMEF